MGIDQGTIEQTAYELMKKAATEIPEDISSAVKHIWSIEKNKLSKTILKHILENFEIASTEGRPVCADTGLPRYYVKCGNGCAVDGGFVVLERALRKATARATRDIPLRPNRVHPLTRKDFENNIGSHAPSITYTFEPGDGWIDITTVHKGGLFGSDYRMLFPSDGIPGIKRFFLETIGQFFRRGLSCQPAVIGVGIGGTKDECFRIGMEASVLRPVEDNHPDSEIALLEKELLDLANSVGFGPMGYPGIQSVMDVHVEIAYAHTGGLPISVHHCCFAARRATARIYQNNTVEYRNDPQWFTQYYRREAIEQETVL